MKLNILLTSFVILGLGPFAAYSQENFVTLPQGWSSDEIQKAYHWNLGAQLMPARWFMALERPDSNETFSKDLERFGFITNTNGIPIGVTFDENELTSHLYGEKKWVGVTCTACHTSALEINGRTVLVNGNQSQINLQSFEASIVKGIEATLIDPLKFARFAQSLSQQNDSSLAKRLSLFRDEFKDGHLLNHLYFDKQNIEVPWGPGRIDGLGGSTNTLACKLTPRMGTLLLTMIFANSHNCGPSHAPTSIPHLWGMTNQNFAQWNGQVHASLGRNVGAMMAGYGKNWVESTLIGTPKVLTTIKIDEVFQVEDLYKKLKAPSWKNVVENKLGYTLDQIKVERGQKLFLQNCQSCHAVQPKLTAANKFGNRYWDFPIIPVKDIGTDPYYSFDEINHETFVSPVLAPVYLAAFGFSDIDLNGKIPAQAARGILPAAAIINYFRENLISPAEIDRMGNCRENKKAGRLDAIKAKSLEGVLFTAPYLHNGSVPTIYDLLAKQNDRPTRFYVGCRKYDLSKFGYVCGPQDKNSFEYDTSRQGNSNHGHEYGTALTETEKAELVEFIKSLEQPSYIPGNADCN